MSQSVVFNKENPTLVLCGGSRSAPRGTPTWALLPRSWTVFGGSSWGLSWRHFCVKETDESTEKIHGKSMTPRKKIHGKLMPSIFQSPDPSPDPKIHDTHGGGSEAPPKAEGEPNPYFHSRAPRGPGASGPPLGPRGSLNASATRQMLRLLRSWPSTRRSYVLQDGPAE